MKSLEIQGFKSFPEKTRLAFDRPVTAIVGPNGSGKSNIADAVLWVMGEQSTRTLRGGKMEDVIFGGTLKRPQVGFAEVSLIVDNTDKLFNIDYTEVAITRRYYRSGDSEYFINKQNVRLKDINELLMDTGLGREGYSIIGQGKIDAILSARSTDRREIFEEAAGISRFRHRKEESERKLAHTDENLVRMGDKISELELQVEPLREQAEIAKRYLLLRDELREQEISLWTHTLDTLQQQATKAEDDLNAALRQKDEAQAELDDYYASLDAFTEKMHDKDLQLEEVRQTISELDAKRAERESAVAVLHTKLDNTVAETDRVRRELDEQAGRDGGIKTQIAEREARIAEIDADKAALAEQSTALSAQLQKIADTSGESSRRVGALLTKENELNASIGDARSTLSALASSAQEMLDREELVAQESAKAASQRRALEAERDDRDAALKKVREERQGLQNVINGYVLRVESRRKKAETAGESKTAMTMELGALKSRINLLTEMEKHYQGYSKAVKLIMQDASRGVLTGIRGTVGDLVKTDDQYAVAIETALGGALQNVIVDAEEDGKRAINYLKRRDGGRATFLPVSTVRGNVLSVKGLDDDPGYEGLAIDLVRFDERYAGIYRSLLGRVAVADTLDSAIRIARRNGNSFRIVTLDGQVINAGGSMTGGSSSYNAGILSRANELKQLSGQQKRLEADAQKIEQEYQDAVREKNAAEFELETSSADIRVLDDQILGLEAEARHSAQMLNAAAEAAAALSAETETLKKRIADNTAKTDETRGQIAALEHELSTVRASIAEDTQGQQALLEERDAVSTAVSELRAKDASLSAERDAFVKAVAELSALRSSLTGGREQQQAYLDELLLRHETILADIAAQETSLSQLQEKETSLKAQTETITAEKLSLEADRTRRDKQLQDKNNELIRLERECGHLEQKKVSAELEEKQIIDKLWDMYELTRSAAIAARQQLTSVTESKRRIAELKREISKLGNPNIGAIEEFDRVNTRYEYLTGQRDDIEQAKQELQTIIRDITKEMRELFAREFEVIRESFRETFLEFFGGGQASLELDDPEDILNCGIEIKVQPPGKSLKTITLLSGGEKAFVAIALYFAILKVRPTPFVVMDEIEAALDEANVRRFAGNMRKMSEKTQMIVITHHRGTMEEADVLYGVTMQEQGVSRVISIDLAEAEQTIKKRA